jgi:DNA-3-methyladenine glycosylase
MPRYLHLSITILYVYARLPRSFFSRPALAVARQLLGTRLVRLDNGERISGLIVEAEAYSGEDDLGCHCRHGRTPRTRVMYGPPGHAYIYFTYGMHWCLNFVAEQEGFPAAVLIRAIQPVEGLEMIAARRGKQPQKHWTDGPAKICQALALDGASNGVDLCSPQALLWLEEGEPVPDEHVLATPRIGLNNVPEPWRSIPWRFLVKSGINP